MKLYHWTILAVIVAIATWSALKTSDTDPRAEIRIDLNWRFMLGDNEEASETAFNDSEWQIVSLPHNWKVEQSKDVGWYRKHLDISRYQTKKQFYLIFDGVYMNSDVWINGNHLGNHLYGNIGFQYDITPFLRKDTINIIAVRADCSKLPADRWCSGAGIYRHVRLIASEKLHFPENNTRITTTEKGGKAQVTAEISVTNFNKKASRFKIKSDLLGPGGSLIQTVLSTAILEPGESTVITENHIIENPKHWSPDTPHLYELHSFMIHKKKLCDNQVVKFGVRTAEFNPDSGFMLNGEKLRLKGVCLHHDGGELGAAVPDLTWEYRLNFLKELGVNALRLADNPHALEVLDMCDRLGFLVINEMENRDLADIEFFKNRDINHPSVILWRLENEDSSSPKHHIDSIVASNFIWTGIDYFGETRARSDRGFRQGLLYTNGFIKPNAYYTQSIYSEDPMVKMVVVDGAYADSLNKVKNWQVKWAQAPLVRHWTFPLDSDNKYLVVFTNCDQVELQLNSKPVGNLSRSDFEDKVIQTELAYEPGILVAKASTRDKNNTSVSVSDTLRTADAPAMIMMNPDKIILMADGQDVMHIETSVRDSIGTLYPTSDHLISYTLDGPGKISAIDNGDPTDHDQLEYLSKRVKNGRHLIIVRSTLQAGDLTISATSEGLTPATVKVQTLPPKE